MRTNYTMYYSVADHLFAIEASAAQEALLTNYAPFRFSQEGPCAPLFTIHVQKIEKEVQKRQPVVVKAKGDIEQYPDCEDWDEDEEYD